MATVIDSLIVTLGLDNKDFKQGVKETEKDLQDTRKNTDKVGKQIANSGKDAAEFFSQMQRAAIKFFAVLTAGRGIVNFTRDVVTSGASLSRMSQNLNISADTLHRWGSAAKLNGGSVEQFMGTMSNLNNQVTEMFMRGESSITPYLRQLGVGITDANNKARPLTDVLTDIAAASEKLFPDKSQRYAYLTQMGFDEGTINLMTKGRAELQKTLAAQQGFSQKDADAALKAEQAWIKAGQRLEKLSRDLVIKLLEPMERMANSFVNFAEIIIPPLSKVLDVFTGLDEMTDGWSTSLVIALGTLRLLGGSAVIGGLKGTAAILAGMAASVAPIAAMFYSKELNAGEEDKLKAIYGDSYAPTTLNPNAPNTGVKYNSIDDAIKKSVAQRNNNPGNLKFAGQRGAIKGDGGFAQFETVEAGISAMHRQLLLYKKRGLDTLDEIINTWAPKKDKNDTQAYIDHMASALGVGPNDFIDVADPAIASKLIEKMSLHESGSNYITQGQILSGLQTGGGASSSSKTISIGKIEVNTQAKDARGIASSLNGELVRQFDAGLS